MCTWKTLQDWNEFDVVNGILVEAQSRGYNLFPVKQIFLDHLDAVHTQTTQTQSGQKSQTEHPSHCTQNMYNLF